MGRACTSKLATNVKVAGNMTLVCFHFYNSPPRLLVLLTDLTDLSPSAFSSIGNLDTGVLNVQWHFMAKGWSP